MTVSVGEGAQKSEPSRTAGVNVAAILENSLQLRRKSPQDPSPLLGFQGKLKRRPTHVYSWKYSRQPKCGTNANVYQLMTFPKILQPHNSQNERLPLPPTPGIWHQNEVGAWAIHLESPIISLPALPISPLPSATNSNSKIPFTYPPLLSTASHYSSLCH